jgi:hypothetical protein
LGLPNEPKEGSNHPRGHRPQQPQVESDHFHQSIEQEHQLGGGDILSHEETGYLILEQGKNLEGRLVFIIEDTPISFLPQLPPVTEQETNFLSFHLLVT